ncbi:MAG: NAD-dependent epimerase/dehydratase family protein [Victivallaceae bacterium]|nr:NAD-dependent epimerase/dehydratase family protein [Victivallaceae bacterium]
MTGINKILPAYAGKKIAITGASGYIGSELVESLKYIEATIYRITSNLKHLPTLSESKAEFIDIEADISKKDIWERLCPSVDVIFHLSSQTNVYTALEDPEADWKINVLPLLNILEVSRELEQKPVIIFTGTATQVGLTEKIPVNENVKDEPVTIYDTHKLAAENYLKVYCANDYAIGTVLRLANVYGYGRSSKNSGRGIVNIMAHKSLTGKTLTIYGNGEYIRDYIYIKDVIKALLCCLPNIDALNGMEFLIASGSGITLKDAVNKIAQEAEILTGTIVNIKHIPAPENLSPIEYRNFIADISNFKNVSGWKPEFTFENGIKELLMETKLSDK